MLAPKSIARDDEPAMGPLPAISEWGKMEILRTAARRLTDLIGYAVLALGAVMFACGVAAVLASAWILA